VQRGAHVELAVSMQVGVVRQDGSHDTLTATLGTNPLP